MSAVWQTCLEGRGSERGTRMRGLPQEQARN